MKKLIAWLLCCSLLVTLSSVFAADEIPVSAQAFVLYCPDNGEILLSENADIPLPMASTTKIMTTLLTLEYASKDNKIVEFTEDMMAEGSSMYLVPGEKVTLRDLAIGMMMQSGNDAANAAAISISGSVEKFSDLMNEKAKEIGMSNTHFVTPSGLDDGRHYSCAEDMAILMAYCLKNKAFANITAQKSMTVYFIEPDGKAVEYSNHNKLLCLYDGCIGGKTGYTEKSGRCLVTAAKKDGVTLIAVTLNDRDDWEDHIGLYNYGFNALTSVNIGDQVDYSVSVVGGKDDSVSLSADTSQTVIVPRNRAGNVKVRYILPPFLYAPVKKGEKAGKIEYFIDDKMIASIPLIICSDINCLK